MSDVQAKLAQWKAFFAKHDILCDVDQISIPHQPPFEGLLLIVPKNLGLRELCELFKDEVWKCGVHSCVTWHQTRESGSEEWVTRHESDDIGFHVRNTEGGDYAFWAKRHVGNSGDGLYAVDEGIFDSRLTLAEALLYHLIMMHEFGEKYVDMHRDHFQPCRGSRSAHNRDAYPCLRWDLQDIKICLDWRLL